MDMINSLPGRVTDSAKSVWSCVKDVSSSTIAIIRPRRYDELSPAGGDPVKFCLAKQSSRSEILEMVAVSPWIQVAGLCGATAVAMGAYGAHVLYPRKDVADELKQTFETANKYHFIHALALLGVPLTRRPHLVGTLMLTGMLVFSGTCYIYALTERKDVIRFTPYGGLTLIASWLAMLIP